MEIEEYIDALTVGGRIIIIDADERYILEIFNNGDYFGANVYEQEEIECRYLRTIRGDFEDFLHQCYDDNVDFKELDWHIFKTRDELNAEIAELQEAFTNVTQPEGGL